MGEDLHPILVDLEEEPEVGHEATLGLLLVQGGTLTLGVAASAVIACQAPKALRSAITRAMRVD